MFEGQANSIGVIFALDFEEGKLEAEFDKMQIKQVLINVIQNSLNAMPEGGAIEIVTSSAGDNITVEISDTGHGIPNEYFDNIFQRFSRPRRGRAPDSAFNMFENNTEPQWKSYDKQQ